MESKRLGFLALMLCLLAMVSGPSAYAQSGKKIDKAIKVFYKKGYQDGINKLRSYMAKEEYPTLNAYETWVQMEYVKYVEQEGGFTVTVEAGDNQEQADSLANNLNNLFKNYAKDYFIDVCRASTIESFSYTADIYLRNFLVDHDPDTAVSEKAKSYFSEGEEFFGKEDYERAELNYRKALNEDTSYYKALLYLGDTFWAREDYDSAIVYFTLAKNMHPELLEPRNYIIDALMEQGLYYRAKKECLEALTVYAGFDVKFRMQQILLVENKYMEDHRFIRYFYPNDVTVADQRELNGIWNTYSSAKEKISRYCNDDGIIEPNGETEDLYLEVYSYRQMLEKHDNELPEHLEFAYKMMEDGYLECYVFISLFHVDIYPQFKHYMSFPENREKSMEYVDKYLIEVYTQ